MRDVIRISWGSGFMNIAVGVFFPTDMSRTRKVFKLLVKDPDWTSDKVDELLDYFGDRLRETEARAKGLQSDADRQKAVADALKAKKPKRNHLEYTKYVNEKEKAYQMGVAARATAREAESLKKTLLLLRELDGRTA